MIGFTIFRAFTVTYVFTDVTSPRILQNMQKYFVEIKNYNTVLEFVCFWTHQTKHLYSGRSNEKHISLHHPHEF